MKAFGLFVSLGLLACGAYASQDVERTTLWEESPADDSYQLAVLQFTERGNLRRRELFSQLVHELDAMESSSLIVVFVHGWKHNAAPNDRNLLSFRHLLQTLRGTKIVAPSRKIVGVYLGWPGASLEVPVLQETTFWARKTVAQSIGKGAVTEVLLALERVQSRSPDRRFLVTIGHSFGGAIVVSAISEVLMSRVIDAESSSACAQVGMDRCTQQCVKARSFGDAVVILNPAIEANELLPLRSVVAERCFPPDQPKLMHVLTTDADRATNKYFPLGQRLSMLAWEEVPDLTFQFRDKNITLDEHALDVTTAGNYPPFWTGRLLSDGNVHRYCSLADKNFHACSEISPDTNAIPTTSFEPLSFISTQRGFMDNHNDIFNRKVIAYIATIVRESVTIRQLQNSEPRYTIDCYNQEFLSFGKCFEKHLKLIPAD